MRITERRLRQVIREVLNEMQTHEAGSSLWDQQYIERLCRRALALNPETVSEYKTKVRDLRSDDIRAGKEVPRIFDSDMDKHSKYYKFNMGGNIAVERAKERAKERKIEEYVTRPSKWYDTLIGLGDKILFEEMAAGGDGGKHEEEDGVIVSVREKFYPGWENPDFQDVIDEVDMKLGL